MKKFMIAVAAVVAISSLSLASCGGKKPADKAAAAAKEYVEAVKADPTKAAEAYQTLETKLQDILKNDCKTAEDSNAVAQAAAQAALDAVK